MGLILVYTLRNLMVRKLTTALTVVGMGLVVFVAASVMMLAHGLETTLVATGSDDNAIFVRKAANTETISLVMRDDAGVATTQPEVAVSSDGTPIAASEIVILVSLDKAGTTDAANVVLRGTQPKALELRRNVQLVEGRMFTPGTSEIVVGRSATKNYAGCKIGQSVRFAMREWTIVGMFDAHGAGFDSELWGDADQVQQAFRRTIYSSVTVRLRDPSQFEQLKTRMETDPRLTVDVKREKEYYAAQSEMMSGFIRVMGTVISVVFSIGAMIGAMITMYAAVANRTREIGTMRAIGFPRRRVLTVFLIEAIWLSLLGGGVGVLAAAMMSFVHVSTTNWTTFSELAFGFALSPSIVIGSFAFAIVMGLVGGFLPAVRAARADIINSLREA
jgi:ABC-type antimicrobial peptide transport system permease subunit